MRRTENQAQNHDDHGSGIGDPGGNACNFAAPPQSQQDAQREGNDDGKGSDDQRQQETAPIYIGIDGRKQLCPIAASNQAKEQQDQVEIAEKALEEARETLRLRRLEVDKLETHRIDWEKEAQKELDLIEGREQDELGSTIYTTNQTRRKVLKMR